MKKYSKGIVVFSGGQDSTTCLGVALEECNEVIAIAFDYGQRHSIELSKAADIAEKYKVRLRIIGVEALRNLVQSALTGSGDVSVRHPQKKNLPASFVPVRNAIFLTLAHALAQNVEASVIYTGVCQTDYSGYPDCRESFIKSLQETLNLGYESQISIVTPLMHLTKAETFALAKRVGFLDTVLKMSHTCYEGDYKTWNDWGYGCGTCPACALRAKGYAEFCATAYT